MFISCSNGPSFEAAERPWTTETAYFKALSPVERRM
jgi:hypothetical protein